jgi:hypothetical protein
MHSMCVADPHVPVQCITTLSVAQQYFRGKIMSPTKMSCKVSGAALKPKIFLYSWPSLDL